MFLFCFITLIPYSGVLLGNGLGSVFGFGAVCLFGGGSPLGSCFRFIRVVVWGSRCSWRLLCGANNFVSVVRVLLIVPLFSLLLCCVACGLQGSPGCTWLHLPVPWVLGVWRLEHYFYTFGFFTQRISCICLILLLVYNYLGTYTWLVDVYLLICL